jgi:DNA-binding Lrp family transcriptional regulator
VLAPCVKALEDAGVIKGYAALLDAKTVGLSVNVFMSVRFRPRTRNRCRPSSGPRRRGRK